MLRNPRSVTLASMAVLLCCGLAAAQEVPGVGAESRARGRVHSDVELDRKVIEVERQAIVSNALELSEDESQGFWPLYREYDAERAKLRDRRVAILLQYEEAYPNLSADEAEKINREVLDLQEDEIKLKKRYLDRFGKVLSKIKTARFYQLERKLDAVESIDLAQSVPLIW